MILCFWANIHFDKWYQTVYIMQKPKQNTTIREAVGWCIIPSLHPFISPQWSRGAISYHRKTDKSLTSNLLLLGYTNVKRVFKDATCTPNRDAAWRLVLSPSITVIWNLEERRRKIKRKLPCQVLALMTFKVLFIFKDECSADNVLLPPLCFWTSASFSSPKRASCSPLFQSKYYTLKLKTYRICLLRKWSLKFKYSGVLSIKPAFGMFKEFPKFDN